MTTIEDSIQRGIHAVEEAAVGLSQYYDRSKAQFGSSEKDAIRWKGIQLQLKVNATKLTQWQSLWLPQTQRPSDLCLALWGPGGEEQLKKLLGTIISYAGQIARRIEPVDGDFETATKQSSTRASRTWWRRTKCSRASVQRSRAESAEPEHSVNLVELREDVTALAGQVEALSAQAELLFRRRHAALPGSTILRGHLEKVLATREVSEALYSLCESQQHSFNLDMNLLNNEDEGDKLTDVFDWWRDLRITYRFLTTDESAQNVVKLVTLEPVATDECANMDPDCYELDMSAILDASQPQSDGLAMLRTSSALEENKRLFFHMKTIRYESTEATVVKNLPISSQNSWTAPLKSFGWSSSLSSRALYAYRVAESGLFLVGTPWLSQLSTAKVRLIEPATAGSQQYLHFNALSMSRDESSLRDDMGISQLYKIGVLLVEIALEVNVDLKSFEDHAATMEQLDRVAYSMGQSYRQACLFCLEAATNSLGSPETTNALPSSARSEWSSEAVLWAYYNEVFIRVRDVWHSL